MIFESKAVIHGRYEQWLLQRPFHAPNRGRVKLVDLGVHTFGMRITHGWCLWHLGSNIGPLSWAKDFALTAMAV